MIPQDLLSYLQEKYKPDAILLHGSRARGDHFADSDYDFLLIGTFVEPALPHRFKNYSLDITSVAPDKKNDLSYGVPTWPLEIVYDNASLYGQEMQTANKLLHEKGPEKVTAQQIESRKDFLRRLSVKLDDRFDNKQCRMHYAADIHIRAIRYYFELSARWNQSLPLALKTIAQENPLLYDALENLFTDDAQTACASVFKILFNEKI